MKEESKPRYEVRATRLTVVAKDQPIFDETATHIAIEDLAGGEYVTLKQCLDESADQEICIEPDAWPYLRDAIDEMIDNCRP